MADPRLERVAEEIREHCIDWQSVPADIVEDAPKWLARRILAIADEGREAVLRPEVRAFAWLMEQALRKHDDTRGPRGWQGDSPDSLVQRVRDETTELAREVGALAVVEANDIPSRLHAANMAMMVADVVGGLVIPMYQLDAYEGGQSDEG